MIDKNESYSDYLREGELCAYGQFCASERQMCPDRDTLEFIADETRQERSRWIEPDPDPVRYARRIEIRDEIGEKITTMRSWSLDREEQRARDGVANLRTMKSLLH